ncbi:aldolase/citrate lyase family protein [Nitratireductor sp. XY-223]|uniref:HpcH/HpaI aldolase family protein n=1 Tax=Nitratireductor sp. XY-223 TaxID=2561926 RepID=UPI00145A1A45|nr:aldolase/citrate lyase family protein [Nitratireductor sp. XY-223]
MLKARLDAGETVLGTWNVIPDPTVVEILADAGFDFVVIDMEHGPHHFVGACDQIRAAEAHGAAALLRPPGVDESAILRALDSGAHGLLVPNISSLAQVQSLVQFAFYPPQGARGHSPFTRAGGFTHVDAGTRMKEMNEKLFLGILIEGTDGLTALPDILTEFGESLGVVYVGLYDLAKSLGQTGNVKHPDVTDSVKKIAAMTAEHGVHCGTLCNDREMLEIVRDAGVRLICYQNDTGIFHEAATQISKTVNEITLGRMS